MGLRSMLGLRFGYQDASKPGDQPFPCDSDNSTLTDPWSGNELSDGRMAVAGEDGLTKGESSGVSRLRGEAGDSTTSIMVWTLGRAREGYLDRT